MRMIRYSYISGYTVDMNWTTSDKSANVWRFWINDWLVLEGLIA